MKITHNLFKYKNLTKFEIKKQQSLKLIVENIWKAINKLLSHIKINIIKKNTKLLIQKFNSASVKNLLYISPLFKTKCMLLNNIITNSISKKLPFTFLIIYFIIHMEIFSKN
ncbi:hypothetical protein AAW50_02580 [Mycoplasmopsis canis]|nr:hypothetical protein AAW50_02580 [Mycoplasmopsis canis]